MSALRRSHLRYHKLIDASRHIEEMRDYHAPPGSRVVISEKLDGANLSFSLADDLSIIPRNRGHHADEQFRSKLPHWVQQHESELRTLLHRDQTWPGRYYPFGEWCNATHAIAYDGLPDRFIAFDLYDRAHGGRFLARHPFERLLAAFAPSIFFVPIVRICEDGRVPSKDELFRLASGVSAFGKGRVPREGIIVKIERDGKVVQRGKVVRAGAFSFLPEDMGRSEPLHRLHCGQRALVEGPAAYERHRRSLRFVISTFLSHSSLYDSTVSYHIAIEQHATTDPLAPSEQL